MDKINILERCVYASPAGLCPGTAPLHPKEHYLPAGFGNFKSDIRLKNFICYDCQKRFSKFEEVFLRNGSEAFFRDILGVSGRKSHQGKNIYADPTLGLPPLTVKGMHPSLPYEVLWHPVSQENAYPMNQLIFRKPDSSLVHVPIRDGSLNKDLERLGETWKSWQLLTCISGDGQEAELQEVLGPSIAALKDAPIERPLGGEFAGRMDATISLPYLQAISKIAFHFVLARFDITGFEVEFDEVKRFIFSGEGSPPATIVEDIILPELIPEDVRMRQWCHVLTAECNRDGFYSRNQFFVGPRLKPFVWRVHLGPNLATADSPTAKGFRFCYFDDADLSGYVGEVIEMGPGPILIAKL